MKKIYNLLQTRWGLVLVVILYFILAIPVSLSSEQVAESLGEQLGKLLSPIVIVFALSRYFNWSKNQKVLHIFLIAFLFEILLTQKGLTSLVSLTSIVALFVLIIQILAEFFKRKNVASEIKQK